MEYCSATAISKEQTIELDYLAFDAFTIETLPIEVKKGYFVHITRDNSLICDGIVSDVRPEKNYQNISIRPLQALFDAEVFYSDISDCIKWIADSISAQFISNSDTVQNRPIDLTYVLSSEALPITEDIDPQKTTTLNILSIIQNALKTYSVLTDCWIDMATRRIKCNIRQVTNTQVVEADLENILDVSITLGDSYGSSNKVYIKKYHYVEELDENDNMVVKEDDNGNRVTEDLDVIEYYLHPDGTIDKTNSNRIFPVFWELSSIKYDDSDSRLEDYTIDIVTEQTWESYDDNAKASQANDHIDAFIRANDYKFTKYIIGIVGEDTWYNYGNVVWNSYNATQKAEKKIDNKDGFLRANDEDFTSYVMDRTWNSYDNNTKAQKKQDCKDDFLRSEDYKFTQYIIRIVGKTTWNNYTDQQKEDAKDYYADSYLADHDEDWTEYTIETVVRTGKTDYEEDYLVLNDVAWTEYTITICEQEARAAAKDYYTDSYLADYYDDWMEYTRIACGQEVWNAYTFNQKTTQKNNNLNAFLMTIDDEWNAEADAKAYEILNPQKYDQEIVLSFHINDLIVHPMAMVIGTVVTIYYEGNQYTSILASRAIEGNKITLTFGALRTELTKKLSLEKIETINKTSS